MKDRPLRSSGSVRAGGVSITLDTPMGCTFIKDSARYMEDLITEQEFRARWEIDDAEWDAIADNRELLDRVRIELRHRIENGDAAREAARFSYPDIIKGLVGLAKNEMVSPRHRIEAARELRAVSGIVKEEATPEHVTIEINIGSKVVRCEGTAPGVLADEAPDPLKPMPHRLTDLIDVVSIEKSDMPWERNDE